MKQEINVTLHDFNKFSESYKLPLDISNLIFNAQAYLLNGDEIYLEKFNEYSMEVLKQEIDLQTKVSLQRKNDIKDLIKLTEDYISYIKIVAIPFHHNSEERDSKNFIIEKNYSIASSLQEKVNYILFSSNEEIRKDFSNLVMLERTFEFLATLLVIVSTFLLVAGIRFIVYPLSFKHYILEEISDNSREVTFIFDSKGKIIKVSKNVEKVLGISNNEVLDRSINFVTIKNPLLQSIFHPVLKVLLDQNKVIDNQVIFNLGDEKLFLTIDYVPIYFLKRFSGVLVRISSIEIKKDKRYLYDAIESERKKISLEIHDWIGRNMSSIIHSLDYMLRSDIGKIPIEIQNDLIRLRTHCQTAVMDMRSIMYELHPYLIDKVGLIPALESYSATFEQMQNIKVNIFYPNKLFELAKTKEIVIYRIIQEALSNVVKHSTASEIDLYLSKEKDTLKVEILDNGAPDENFTAGKGLWGMKERANSIGGDLTFSGNKQNGFTVTLTVPLSKEEN